MKPAETKLGKTSTPRVPYRETIRQAARIDNRYKRQTGGHGQYGHVVIEFAPAEMGEGCESFPMTAIVTMEDAGDGKTLYRAVALHRNEADRDMHANMGFDEGWGKCAGQLEELAQGLAANA